jgi:hypothetical protein
VGVLNESQHRLDHPGREAGNSGRLTRL